jgi:hypothetical protein
MRRLIAVALAVFVAGVLFSSVAWAGSPHFVSVSASRNGDTLTIEGKETGLGDEEQVNILVTATAACVNKGEKHPKAANKESLSEEGEEPVQNGKALFSFELTATFQPECSPPMTVEFTNVTVSDLTNKISTKLNGTF